MELHTRCTWIYGLAVTTQYVYENTEADNPLCRFSLYQLASDTTPTDKFALSTLLNRILLDLLMVNFKFVPQSVKKEMKSSMDVSKFEVPED